MRKTFWIIAGILAIGVGVWYFFVRAEHVVVVEAQYVGKTVYGKTFDGEVSDLRAHCDEKGGIFNECGSPCGPEDEICVKMCAFTCEF